MLEQLKKLRAETQSELFKDEPLMTDKDIAYDKGYIAGTSDHADERLYVHLSLRLHTHQNKYTQLQLPTNRYLTQTN